MNFLPLLKSTLSNPSILKVKPSINLFLIKYLNKFKITNVNGQSIIHSHLPAINSKAYSRFIKEHMLCTEDKPAHAQIGITSKCHQNCPYCYNKDRSGKEIDTKSIKQLIQNLKKMGVVWIGLTGGEPLLNKDIVEIIRSAGNDVTIKLFTTGYNLTEELAKDLKQAGLSSVSISLDSWIETEHDKARNYEGSFKTAMKALKIFKEAGIHVGVSSVLTRQMIKNGTDEFIEHLIELGIHEAWLSEVKPSVKEIQDDDMIITKEEQQKLINLQDRYNKEGKITVNYLGHFESGENFGCSAGKKMIYIDSYGEVSPCVFTPITFGNVKESSIQEIYSNMKDYFPTENTCFINKNYKLLQKYSSDKPFICKEDTLKMMEEVEFGPLSGFYKIYYK